MSQTTPQRVSLNRALGRQGFALRADRYICRAVWKCEIWVVDVTSPQHPPVGHLVPVTSAEQGGRFRFHALGDE